MAILANDACGAPLDLDENLPWTLINGTDLRLNLEKVSKAKVLKEAFEIDSKVWEEIEGTLSVICKGHPLKDMTPMPRRQRKFLKFCRRNVTDSEALAAMELLFSFQSPGILNDLEGP